MIVGEQCSTGSVPQDAGAGLASPYAGASPLHGVADTSTSREAVIGSLAVCRATAREQLSSFINAQASRIGESDQTNKSTCCNASRHVYGPNMIGRTPKWMGKLRNSNLDTAIVNVTTASFFRRVKTGFHSARVRCSFCAS